MTQKKQTELFVEPAGPDDKALATVPVNRTRKRAVRASAPKPAPVHTITPHPLAVGVAHVLMDAHGYKAMRTIDANTIVVVNHPGR